MQNGLQGKIVGLFLPFLTTFIGTDVLGCILDIFGYLESDTIFLCKIAQAELELMESFCEERLM